MSNKTLTVMAGAARFLLPTKFKSGLPRPLAMRISAPVLQGQSTCIGGSESWKYNTAQAEIPDLVSFEPVGETRHHLKLVASYESKGVSND